MNLPMKKQLEKIYGKPRRRKPQKRRTEVLTDADIKSLMGINRPVYARGKGGAYRQR